MRKASTSRRRDLGKVLSTHHDEYRRAWPAVALVFVSGLATVSCSDPDFNRPELLELPRVLAVQAEPPQPSFGVSSTLRALVYEPKVEGDHPECVGVDPRALYHWSWCPLPTSSTNGFECPAEAKEMLDGIFAMLGLGPAPSLDLGNGETATLTNPFPTPLLHSLCKGEIPMSTPALPAGIADAGIELNPASIFSCRFSAGDNPKKDMASSRPTAFPVTIRLEYTPPCGSPPQEKFGTPLITIFTVFLPTDETVPPNQNPVVGAIYVDPTAKSSSSVTPIPGGSNPDAGAPANSDSYDGGAAYDGGTSYDGGAAYDGGEPPDASSPAGTSGVPPAGGYAMDAVIFPRQKRVGLWLDLPMSSSEFLPRPAMLDVVKNDPADMRIYHFEQLDVAWFTEAGDFGGGHGRGGHRTGYEPTYNAEVRPEVDEQNLEDRGRENYIAFPLHEDYKQDTARIIAVVRDSRGGVTWTSGVATMEDHP